MQKSVKIDKKSLKNEVLGVPEALWEGSGSPNGAKIIQKSILNSVPFSVTFLINFWIIFGAQTLQKPWFRIIGPSKITHLALSEKSAKK